MDVDDEEDLVPEITKAHFEEAMKFARRLLPHSDDHVNSSVYVSYLYTSAGLCPTTTSRSTRCSRRPFSRAVASATTSGLNENATYLVILGYPRLFFDTVS